MTNILLVEDEESFSEAISFLLKKEGFLVSIATTGPGALEEFDRNGADLILLDLMLPGLSGTEVCRQHFHEDIWIMSLERQLSQLPETAKIVITDCRFENEAAMIRSMGGIVIHIRRWITAPGLRTNTNSRNHKSESGIEVNDSDMIISNNGTLQELHENVYNILSK